MTVSMSFTLGIVKGWAAASVNFKNAFVQALLPELICLDLPPGFLSANPLHEDELIEVKTRPCGERCTANPWCCKVTRSVGAQ
jgi:hypothetical protein